MDEIVIKSIKNIGLAGSRIVDLIRNNNKVFCIYGEMGTGKTTLIKKTCELLNVKENVTSPTFTIINEYLSAEYGKIYHFDFYRINNIKEIYDIGVEEYFDDDCIIFIEWPGIVKSILPPKHIQINIKENKEKHRIISTTEIK